MKYMLWKGFYHDFSTKKAPWSPPRDSAPWTPDGGAALDPKCSLAPPNDFPCAAAPLCASALEDRDYEPQAKYFIREKWRP